MQIIWSNHGEPVSMKTFLTRHGVSMRLIKDVKHGVGEFIVDQHVKAGVITVPTGAEAGLQLPAEAADESLAISHQPIEVIWENRDWLVVNKPAGLASVTGPSNQTDTLVNRIKGYLVDQQAENQRPHLVTRLDFDTSGLVLVAKHRLAQASAMQAKTKKTYLAVVAGQLTNDHGLINQPIGLPAGKIKRAVLANGQIAKTEYWVLARMPQATVVRVRLHTGRTHQIRVHFQSLGHPLLGDQLYGGPMDQGIERQALHAWQYQLEDSLAETTRDWQAPIPADLQQILPADWQSDN